MRDPSVENVEEVETEAAANAVEVCELGDLRDTKGGFWGPNLDTHNGWFTI